MFGQNNDQANDQIPEHSIQGALNSDDAVAAEPQSNNDQTHTWGHPGVPIDPVQTVPPAPSAPADNNGAAANDQQPEPAAPDNVTNDLIDIKQKALTQLTPLVSHLEQPPEEKFRTTMMMIQASDDQSLIPVAYEAANAISDEKAKAQALLDIVNEINYFTSHNQQ